MYVLLSCYRTGKLDQICPQVDTLILAMFASNLSLNEMEKDQNVTNSYRSKEEKTMTTKATKNSIQKTARFAAVLYFLITILSIPVHFVIPSQLIVAGDAAATANNIMASPGLFRMGIGAELVLLLCEIVLSVLLYVLLKPVSRTLSLVAAASRLTMTIIHGVNLLTHFIVLLILSGAGYMAVFQLNQLQALALVFLNAYDYGFSIGIVFLFLHASILGYLIFKSSYFPRIIGILFMIASLGYLIDSFSHVLIPNYKTGPVYLALPIAIAEIAFPLWLLIKGVNTEKWEKRAVESAELEPRRSGSHAGFEPAPAGQLIADPQPRR